MKSIKIPELEELRNKCARSKEYWTDEADEIIKTYYNKVYARDIAKVLNERFGTNYTKTQIHSRAGRLGLTKGIR